MAVDINELIFAEPNQPQSQEEGIGGYLGRNLLAGLSRVAETPLNIHQALLGQSKDIRQQFENKIPGISQAMGPTVGEQLPIPTSEQFRRGAEKKLGYEKEAFEPKDLLESILQEGVSTAALTGLTGGTGALAKSAKPIAAGAVLGNVAEEVGNWLGLDEGMKSALHFTGNILGQQYGTRSKVVKDYTKNYKQADEAIPANTFQKSKDFMQKAHALQDKAAKFPGYEKAEPIAQKFTQLLQGDRVNVKDALEFKKRLNQISPMLSPEIRREFTTPMLNVLKEDVINPYGRSNPKFYNPYLRAEKDFAATKQGLIKFDKLKDGIIKLAGEKLQLDPEKFGPWANLGIKLMLYASPFGGLYKPGIAGVAAAGYTGQQVNKFVGLMTKSPTAKQIFKETQKNLMAGNIATASKNLKKFDKIAEDKIGVDLDELVFA